MEITEVRVKLMEESGDRLQAFCSITFDDSFVIRDLKIIDGANGPFVAMPSRKLTSHCPQCGCKNHLRAAYCNQCGLRLKDDRAIRDQEGRTKLYADIAHPINSRCREMIQERVIREFRGELERAQQPGYVSRYDDDYGDADIMDAGPEDAGPTRAPGERKQIQPAESEPRPPHITQNQPGWTRKRNDDFGAGIL
jgi:stage V sporulation protein G